MTLRRAASIALVGLAWTALHKALIASFPGLGSPGPARTLMSLLWVVAVAALILFAVRFLAEVAPADRGIRRREGGSNMNDAWKVLVGAVLASTACAGDGGAPPDADPLAAIPEAIPTEVLRLGGVEAPEEVSFRSEPLLAVHGGRLYVLHFWQGRVAVLDSTGSLLRWIGGLGSGPGEFEMAAADMGFVGDTLWVRNLPSPRISRFLADGTHLSTDRTPYDYGYVMSMPQGLAGYLAGGRAWVDAFGNAAGTGGPVDLPVLVGNPAMNPADTLFTVRNPAGNVAGMPVAPYPTPPFYDVATDGSGIALAVWSDDEPARVHVRFFTPDGVEAHGWPVRFPVVPVPATVRDSVIAAVIDSARALAIRLHAQGIMENSLERVDREEVERRAYLPHDEPPIRTVLVGLDRTLWLERNEAQRPGTWLAFDLDGHPLFRVRLPAGVTLRQASTTTLWGTVRDDLDVPYLVRWNLRREP